MFSEICYALSRNWLACFLLGCLLFLFITPLGRTALVVAAVSWLIWA